MQDHGETEPAQLLRSQASADFLLKISKNEVIGQGPLWKMIRAALTDPDGEIWRYSIIVGRETIMGEAIRMIVVRPRQDEGPL